LIGEFTGVSGSNKRLKKIRKSRAKLDKAQANFVATASVKTTGGGRRALTAAEARRFLNDTNVNTNALQGRSGARRKAASKVQLAKTAHLANFGRKPKTTVTKNAGRRLH
jgi:hypothetical protein